MDSNVQQTMRTRWLFERLNSRLSFAIDSTHYVRRDKSERKLECQGMMPWIAFQRIYWHASHKRFKWINRLKKREWSSCFHISLTRNLGIVVSQETEKVGIWEESPSSLIYSFHFDYICFWSLSVVCLLTASYSLLLYSHHTSISSVNLHVRARNHCSTSICFLSTRMPRLEWSSLRILI